MHAPTALDWCWILTVAILYGYVFGLEPAFRPLAGGPATNPLTLALSLLAAVAAILLAGQPPQSERPTPALAAALHAGLWLALARLAEASLGLSHLQDALNSLTLQPLHAASELPNETAWNTALFFACYFAGLWAQSRRRPHAALAALAVAGACAATSAAGYALGMPALHGTMSPATLTLCGLLLAGAAGPARRAARGVARQG
jgi:hypothetical protein